MKKILYFLTFCLFVVNLFSQTVIYDSPIRINQNVPGAKVYESSYIIDALNPGVYDLGVFVELNLIMNPYSIEVSVFDSNNNSIPGSSCGNYYTFDYFQTNTSYYRVKIRITYMAWQNISTLTCGTSSAGYRIITGI